MTVDRNLIFQRGIFPCLRPIAVAKSLWSSTRPMIGCLLGRRMGRACCLGATAGVHSTSG